MRISTIVSAAAGAALLLSPAATLAAPAPQAVTQSAPSAWMALSMLNSSGSVGLGDVAVQPASSQNPPPPDRYNVGGVPTPVVALGSDRCSNGLPRDQAQQWQLPSHGQQPRIIAISAAPAVLRQMKMRAPAHKDAAVEASR
jgi:hypothetical protein